jgi:hypothetical protein
VQYVSAIGSHSFSREKTLIKFILAALAVVIAAVVILTISEALMMTANALSNRGNADMNRHVRYLMKLAAGTFIFFGGFLCLMTGSTQMLALVAFMSFSVYNVFMLAIKGWVAAGEVCDRFGRVQETFEAEAVDVPGYATVYGTTICAAGFAVLLGVIGGIAALNPLTGLATSAMAAAAIAVPWLLAVLRIKRIINIRF